jgi:hypothetical protein
MRDLNHLQARTTEAAERATRDMPQRVGQEVVYQLETCRVTDGAHVESYCVQNYSSYDLK